MQELIVAFMTTFSKKKKKVFFVSATKVQFMHKEAGHNLQLQVTHSSILTV